MIGRLVAGLLLVGAAAPAAQAYVLLTSLSGEPAHWTTPCLQWWMNESGTEDAPLEATFDALQASFDTWQAVEAAWPAFSYRGATCVDQTTVRTTDPVNVLMWHEGEGAWPHPRRVVGLTSVTVNDTTGAIVDADIEFDGEDFSFTVDGAIGRFDIQQVATHEIGHVLGLDHTPLFEATMYEKTKPDETWRRELHSDDINGFVASHPLSQRPVGEGCAAVEPVPFDAPQCPAPPGDGCAASSATGGGALAAPLALLLLGWLLRRSRRREAVVIMAALAVLLVAPGAEAWRAVRTASGEVVTWRIPTVPFRIDDRLPPDYDSERVTEIIAAAMLAWNDLDCGAPTLLSEGFVGDAVSSTDDGVNHLLWLQDEWPHPTHLLALTRLFFAPSDGRILDAEIEVNNALKAFDLDAECTDGGLLYDLLAVLTHEFGHTLGLDHSLAPNATMVEYTSRAIQCQLRTLSGDDEDGVCALYHVTAPVEPSDAEPGPEGAPELGGPSDLAPTTDALEGQPGREPDDCSGAGAGGGPSGPWLPLLALLWATRAARRASHRGPRSRLRAQPR